MSDARSPVGVLLSYGAYLPSGRLDRAEVGATLGTGGGPPPTSTPWCGRNGSGTSSTRR